MKLILLGPPGSGKGTVAERLEKELGLLHLSAGELLREEVSKGTTIGKDIQKIIEKGNFVPDQLIVEMIKLEIEGKENYILDGFPRTLKQAEAIADLPIDVVINLDVPEKVMVERFAGRRVCTKNNHGYHIKNIPPKKEGICDYDGSPLIRRKDDAPIVIKERFKVYHQLTQPLIAYYQKKGLLQTINGNQDPDIVYADLKKAIEEFL